MTEFSPQIMIISVFFGRVKDKQTKNSQKQSFPAA